MSQKIKRCHKKLAMLSENYEREADINKLIDIYTKVIEELNDELDLIWDNYEANMAYIYNSDDTANVSYDLLEMPDGRQLEVMILETQREVNVAYDGLIGRAKAHEHDNWNFETGYSIAATRLMMKILQKENDF